MKKVTACLLILVMAGAALAGTEKPAQRMDIETFLMMNRLHGPAYDSRSFFEGFEGGVIPPTWNQHITNPSRPWSVSSQTSVGSLEGLYCAFVGYDLYVWQDERISFTHAVDVAGGSYILSFWMAGSRQDYWSPYVAETVEVNGTTVFDFDSSTNLQFTWEKFFVDLTPWDGQIVTITFRYLGVDGDLHVLDAVAIDDGTGYDVPPPPPPPTNDLCQDAIDLQAQSMTMFQVDLCLANNTYNAGSVSPSCTGYTSNGRDVVYKIYLMAGENLTISQQGAHDSSIWVATDCNNLAGTCVAGADVTFTGGIETVSIAAPFTGWFYIIIDGWGTDACSLTTVWVDAPVATVDASWSSIKTLYR